MMLCPKATAPAGGVSSGCGARLSLLSSGEEVVKKLWWEAEHQPWPCS